MSPPITIPLASATMLKVPLHRQDTSTHCGAACIQMIRAASGVPFNLLVQRELQKAALDPGLPSECRSTLSNGDPEWHMCPPALAESLAGPGSDAYAVRHHQYRNTLLAEMQAACGTALVPGRPSVIAVDSGAHWLVVHGLSRDTAGGYYLDLRDPWPPVRIDPETIGGPVEHEDDDCGARDESASSYLLFPAGISWRVGPIDKGGLWHGRYVAVVPSEVAQVASGVADPPLPLGGAIATTTSPVARSAAIQSFAQAKQLGWPPAMEEVVRTGRTVRVRNETWCGEPFCWKAETNHLVELKRAVGPDRTVALAFVASQGRFAGQTRELIAMAHGRSWILSQAELRRRARQTITAAREAAVRAPVPDAAQGPSPIRQSPPNAQGGPAMPSPAPAAPLPQWLATAPIKDIKTGYFWRSCAYTRSPFHPLIQLTLGDLTAWITPDGNIVTTLGLDDRHT